MPFQVTKPYFPVPFVFFLHFFISNRTMRDIWVHYSAQCIAQHTWTDASWWVPTSADTQSSMALWLYWGHRNGPGPACLHWSIKWASGGQSSSLLRPLFTLTFIELINKALGFGAGLTSPLLLLVAFITVIQTKVALGITGFWFYRMSLPTFGEKKKSPSRLFPLI